MTDRYAVIGNPIAHSKSPLIHAAFARETGQDLEYGRILGDADDFAGAVRRFVAAGGRGLNVTLPFKEAACALADEISPAAAQAGAVNTLIVLAGGRLRGDNTDGVGLVRDLVVNHGFDFRGARVLLIGAGGAARGVLHPLLATAIASLTLANRGADKARQLVARFRAQAPIADPASPLPSPLPAVGLVREARDQAGGQVAPLTAENKGSEGKEGAKGGGASDAFSSSQGAQILANGFEELSGHSFDLIINATSAGLNGAVPAIPSGCLASGGWTYDMLYADQPTAFCRWGQAQGASHALDGLGMLVEQAAESFRLWRGVRPSTAPVIRWLRAGVTPLP